MLYSPIHQLDLTVTVNNLLYRPDKDKRAKNIWEIKHALQCF